MNMLEQEARFLQRQMEIAETHGDDYEYERLLRRLEHVQYAIANVRYYDDEIEAEFNAAKDSHV